VKIGRFLVSLMTSEHRPMPIDNPRGLGVRSSSESLRVSRVSLSNAGHWPTNLNDTETVVVLELRERLGVITCGQDDE
jgi:hypothetical protein